MGEEKPSKQRKNSGKTQVYGFDKNSCHWKKRGLKMWCRIPCNLLHIFPSHFGTSNLLLEKASVSTLGISMKTRNSDFLLPPAIGIFGEFPVKTRISLGRKSFPANSWEIQISWSYLEKSLYNLTYRILYRSFSFLPVGFYKIFQVWTSQASFFVSEGGFFILPQVGVFTHPDLFIEIPSPKIKTLNLYDLALDWGTLFWWSNTFPMIFHHFAIYFRCGPLPATVTTKNITFLGSRIPTVQP